MTPYMFQWSVLLSSYQLIRKDDAYNFATSHLAHILRSNTSGGLASMLGLLWCFRFFFFFLQDFFFLFLRHFLAFLSLASSSLLSLERPIIGTTSTLFSTISSRISIFKAKWQVSFFDDGTLWRTSIWNRNNNKLYLPYKSHRIIYKIKYISIERGARLTNILIQLII